MNTILKESLCLNPLILENHFPKAYLALERIGHAFPGFSEDFLRETWARQDLTSFPKTQRAICENVEVPNLFAEREKRMLSRSLFPSVYGIVLKKIMSLGAHAFLKPYLRIAIEDPEYLGHRFTILVAFKEMWQKIESDQELVHLWVDRLTEFLMTSFNNKQTDYSLKKYDSVGDENFNEVFNLTLLKPGFFGHHLITLATVKRFEKELLKSETTELLAKVKAMTGLSYADAEDFVVINKPKGDERIENFEKTVENYLKQGPDDTHLITFADAMITLWSVADVNQKRFIQANFTRFMRR